MLKRNLFSEIKSGEIIVVDVEGAEESAKFTFTGTTKASLPDSPEDLAETAKQFQFVLLIETSFQDLELDQDRKFV